MIMYSVLIWQKINAHSENIEYYLILNTKSIRNKNITKK